MERFGFDEHEFEPGIDTMARLEMLDGLAAHRERLAGEATSHEINRDPFLHAAMSKLINAGPELDPGIVSHLRRMIALRLGTLLREQVAADKDRQFVELIYGQVQSEYDELVTVWGDDPLPDAWDIAYQDLCELEGE